MSVRSTTRGFLLGLLPGALVGVCLVYLLSGGFHGFPQAGVISWLDGLWQGAVDNLRGSILPFAILSLVYVRELASLRRQVNSARPCLEDVVRGEQIVDLCASLFFGVGVIWTAIGMRDALIQALAVPGVDGGAFDVLQRIVDGGILLALSTTIVGGVGGYLMRAAKSVLVGQRLNQVYTHASQAPLVQGLASLQRIEASLCAQQCERETDP